MPMSIHLLTELWRSLGLELMIFGITLTFALAIRNAPSKRMTRKSAKAAPPPIAGGEVRLFPGPAAPQRASSTPSVTRLPGDSAERPREPREHRRFRDPVMLMREIIMGMRDQPGTRAANRALALYVDLNSSLRDVSITEVARQSHFTPLELYATMVQCAIRVGKYHLVETLLDDMGRHGVSRPLGFYESVMKQLAGQKHFHLALSMYDRLVADALAPSAVTCSCLISFAAEVGQLHRAVGFFEMLSSMTTPSIRAYMTVLRVHAKRQDWPASLACFRDMQRRGAKLDSLVLNIIIATGVAADQLEGIECLVAEADEFVPPITDVVSYNTLIKGYAQRNDSESAIKVIGRMRKRGLAMNAITYNTAMDAAVRSTRSGEVLDLLRDMRSSGIQPDKFTCSILVKGLAKTQTSEFMQASFELLKEVNHTCDVTLRSTLFHSVLEAAATSTDTVMLTQIFSQMRQHNVVPTPSAYRLLVRKLGQDGDTAKCSQFLQEMLSEDTRPQASVFGALLENHLRQGEVDGAMAAFDGLRCKIRSGPNAPGRSDDASLLEECRVTFLRGLCRASREAEATHLYLQSRADGALDSFDVSTRMMLAKLQADSGNLTHAWMSIEDMVDSGHKPSEATLQTFINACIKQSHTPYAKALLLKAASSKLTLTQDTYVLLLKLYGHCQQLQDALSVFADMTERQGTEPTPQTIICLLRTCFQCRQPGRGLELLERLQAKRDADTLDGSVYRVALGCCASAGLLERGVKLAEQALYRGAELPPDSLEVLAQEARWHGRAPELQKLKQLADKHGFKLEV